MAAEPGTVPSDERIAARRRSYRGISFGTTMICTGIILLLNTQGVVGWVVWLDLIRLWPVFLISIGMRLLFVGTRAHPLGLIGPLIVVLAASWAVMVNLDEGGPRAAGLDGLPALDLACPATTEGRPSRLTARFAGGDLLMRAATAPGPEAPSGFSGSFRYEGDEPAVRCSPSGNLWIGYEGRRRHFHVVSPFGRWGNRWDATFATAAPVDMDLDLAASTADIDLGVLDLHDLDLEAAVASLTLRLGAPRGRVAIKIDGAMTSLRIMVPEGTCYRVDRDRAFNVIEADDAGGRVRGSRRVVSESCRTSDSPSYDITYDLPFSIVDIETGGMETAAGTAVPGGRLIARRAPGGPSSPGR